MGHAGRQCLWAKGEAGSMISSNWTDGLQGRQDCMVRLYGVGAFTEERAGRENMLSAGHLRMAQQVHDEPVRC